VAFFATGPRPVENSVDFNAAIDAREDADYQYNYSKETAAESLKRAKKFNTLKGR